MAAVRADAVASLRQPERRRIELGKVLTGLAEQRGEMLPLERDRGAFRVVLIVGSSRPGRLDDPGELPLKPVQPPGSARPIRRQQLRYGLALCHSSLIPGRQQEGRPGRTGKSSKVIREPVSDRGSPVRGRGERPPARVPQRSWPRLRTECAPAALSGLGLAQRRRPAEQTADRVAHRRPRGTGVQQPDAGRARPAHRGPPAHLRSARRRRFAVDPAPVGLLRPGAWL
jgi:hypothetical protein